MLGQGDVRRLLAAVDWNRLLSPLLPITERLTCAGALDAFRPVLDALSPEPKEGWLPYTYQVALAQLFPQDDHDHTAAQQDGALFFLRFLQSLFTLEREHRNATP